jgi:ABC-type branched-subunit amino acid transport system substrate-binding protein
MKLIPRKYRFLLTCAVYAAVAVLLGACSSGGSSSTVAASGDSASAASSPGNSGAGKPAATGSPIKIMVISVRSTPELVAPQVWSGADARADAINAVGGINGHPIDVIACDSNFDPNQEAACLRTAVSDNVSAVVGSYILYGNLDILQKAKIPLVAPWGIAQFEYQSPVSYPFGSELSWYLGMATIAKEDGLKTVKLEGVNTAAAAEADTLISGALQQEGIKDIGNVTSNIDGTDFTADAALLMQGNPGGIILGGLVPNVFPKIVTDLRQAGYTGKLITISPFTDPTTLASLGSMADGLQVSLDAWPVTATNQPVVQEYLSEMQQYAKGAKEDEFSEFGWSGVDVFANVMKNATSYTAASVTAAFSALANPVEAGVFGPFVGTGTSPVATWPRGFNHEFINATVKNGIVVPIGTWQTVG